MKVVYIYSAAEVAWQIKKQLGITCKIKLTRDPLVEEDMVIVTSKVHVEIPSGRVVEETSKDRFRLYPERKSLNQIVKDVSRSIKRSTRGHDQNR